MSQLLGTTDAAIKIGCSPEWVRRLADSGKLPAERTANGTRIFKTSDVEQFLQERQREKEQAACAA